MSFNLDDYEPVATRLAKWRDDVLNRGFEPRVKTEMIASEPGKWCQFKASLWISTPVSLQPEHSMEFMISTGWAEEHATDRGVNSTSHVENCETSAVGRALANAGYAGSDPAKRASREEMAKVRRMEDHRSRGEAPTRPQEPRKDLGGARAASEGQITLIKSMMTERGLELTIPESLTFQDASEIITELKKTPKVK